MKPWQPLVFVGFSFFYYSHLLWALLEFLLCELNNFLKTEKIVIDIQSVDRSIDRWLERRIGRLSICRKKGMMETVEALHRISIPKSFAQLLLLLHLNWLKSNWKILPFVVQLSNVILKIPKGCFILHCKSAATCNRQVCVSARR